MSTLVMKFGGAAMADEERFSHLADLIAERKKVFPRIVVVVSAMGKTTDLLMKQAKKVHPNPPKREQDMLISTGERVSMALLSMSLDLKGIRAISFTGSQSGIITSNQHSEAQILEVRPHRIEEALSQNKVVIVAGFQGVSEEKEITTLGRGGSDTSAVALASVLKAKKVEFYKDVPGIGEQDPKNHPETEIFEKLSYEEALEIIGRGAEVLHHRALELAKKSNLSLEIYPYYDPYHVGTVVGNKSGAYV